jgi:hypothetical protein
MINNEVSSSIKCFMGYCLSFEKSNGAFLVSI